MSTFPPTVALTYGIHKVPVYVHKPCLAVMTWSSVEEAEYGPIDGQGCDRCEGAPDGQWAQLRVPL